MAFHQEFSAFEIEKLLFVGNAPCEGKKGGSDGLFVPK
jgi:hypothetical protein